LNAAAIWVTGAVCGAVGTSSYSGYVAYPQDWKESMFKFFRREAWESRAENHRRRLHHDGGAWRYLELVRVHATTGVNYYKALPFFAIPLMIRARTLVELGSSFSYYPETYENETPWGVSSAGDEGVVSTRILLSACYFLDRLGVPARLTSVDIRDSALFANVERLLTDLGLRDYWEPRMRTNTLDWLQERKSLTRQNKAEPIDFALVDSNHTFKQVKEELKGLVDIMSPDGIILVDDAYITNYRHGVDWVPEESAAGRKRGGEYGAILEFQSSHPDWGAEWTPDGMVFLSRRLKSRDSLHRP